MPPAALTLMRDGPALQPAALRTAVEARLAALVPDADGSDAVTSRLQLAPAMRYALLAPGKRMRPVLVLLIAQAAGRRPADVMDVACAVEMVHTASLVLDDLPCMDDAGLRRGLPTTHRRYGEAVAILAAISLLSRAFELVARSETLDAAARSAICAVLGRAVGFEGLSAGQEIDLTGGSALDLAAVSRSHGLKTGALFAGAVEAAGLAARVDGSDMAALARFSHHLGLAFQALDDLIDLADEAHAGKSTARDGERPSIVTLFGEDEAHAQFAARMGDARAALARTGFDSSPVRDYVDAMLRDTPASA